ncbi:MAG: PocR ligand-binding domain-containing protein [Verrucomicrobiaceae bacterium]|nr:PocR ligand-binding domain-containing protein [Verrucomicrobiaceae bacterium]
MNLFSSFLKALDPDSLLDVIPKKVLQVLLRGFYHQDRVGMTLLYNHKTKPPPDGNKFHHLDAEYGGGKDLRDYWNPFCRAFRDITVDGKRPCDALCVACDDRRAKEVYDTGQNSVKPYKCHMGLLDMRRGFTLCGKTAGVLFAGQLSEQENERQLAQTESRLRHLLAGREDSGDRLEPAPDYGEGLDLKVNELMSELRKAAKPANNIADFKKAFTEFTAAVQETIDELYQAKLNREIQAAIVAVNDALADVFSSNPDGWVKPANKVLTDLELVLGGRPSFFMVRRGEDYEVLAASGTCGAPLDAPPAFRATRNKVSIHVSLDVPSNRWTEYSVSSAKAIAWRQAMSWLPAKNLWTYRLDESSGGKNLLSVVLVIVGGPPTGLHNDALQAQTELVVGCASAIGAYAHRGTLMEQQRAQQEEFRKQVSFTGHHLKTPLQNAFSTLHDIARLGDANADISKERRALCDQVRSYLQTAQSDALMLQATTKMEPEPVDVYQLTETMLKHFEARAREKMIDLKLAPRPDGCSCEVFSVISHLRKAFTNLLDNAVKYSFLNKAVNIRLRVSSQVYLEVSIRNEGVGFKSAERPALFKYAKRAIEVLKNDRKRKRPGQGLGLAQSDSLIKGCGGTLTIDSKGPLGFTHDKPPVEIFETTVTVLLPLLLSNQ